MRSVRPQASTPPSFRAPVPDLLRPAAAVAVAGALLLAASPGFAQSGAPPACADQAAFHALDFWVGEWVVEVDGREVGRNRIEKVLDGCAVMEHWRSARGAEGKSLFYHVPATGAWRQVWVTGQATAPGGVKEKELVERTDDGGVRFQGEIPLPEGGAYLDRTTLTPLDRGRVRQRIEISRDGGDSWSVAFDAVYRPIGASPGP